MQTAIKSAHLLDTDVYNEQGSAKGQHADTRICVELNKHPRPCTAHAHQCDKGCRLQPVLCRETLLPVQARAALHLKTNVTISIWFISDWQGQKIKIASSNLYCFYYSLFWRYDILELSILLILFIYSIY